MAVGAVCGVRHGLSDGTAIVEEIEHNNRY